jgi:hypothetical protein
MIVTLNAPVFNEMYCVYYRFRQARFGVTTHSNDSSTHGTRFHVDPVLSRCEPERRVAYFLVDPRCYFFVAGVDSIA